MNWMGWDGVQQCGRMYTTNQSFHPPTHPPTHSSYLHPPIFAGQVKGRLSSFSPCVHPLHLPLFLIGLEEEADDGCVSIHDCGH